MSPTSQPVAKLWTAQSCAPAWSDRDDLLVLLGRIGRRSRTRPWSRMTSAGSAASMHERLGEDRDVVAEDGGDLVRVAGAADVAQQRDPVDGLAHVRVEARLLAQRHRQEARPQLRLERLAERVVLRERERRDELTEAERSDRKWGTLPMSWRGTRPYTIQRAQRSDHERSVAMNELCSKGAGELAGMIASGEVTSTEVVDAHLARIEEVNPDLNAVTVTLADEARAAAAAVDRAVAAGEPLGPLAGVPFTVKENIDVAGSATTWGVAALAGQIASTDAPMVARLREAGAIPLARTNLPDFAFRWDTESGRAGRTRNPWDPTRTPGGSSGGEAVALATGMTPLGLGNDLGGSLRVPSQMCGIDGDPAVARARRRRGRHRAGRPADRRSR